MIPVLFDDSEIPGLLPGMKKNAWKEIEITYTSTCAGVLPTVPLNQFAGLLYVRSDRGTAGVMSL